MTDEQLAEIARRHCGPEYRGHWESAMIAAMREAIAAQERELEAAKYYLAPSPVTTEHLPQDTEKPRGILVMPWKAEAERLAAQLSQAESDLEHAERNEEEQALTIHNLSGRLSQAQADTIERCAKVCELDSSTTGTAMRCAAAIRALSAQGQGGVE